MRDIVLGFMRVYVLRHAADGPTFGLEMIDNSRRHGYGISLGTPNPMLHSPEEAGAMCSGQSIVAGWTPRYYRTTKSAAAIIARGASTTGSPVR